MGCIVAIECYSLMLGEYSVELTNSRKLVMKLGWLSSLAPDETVIFWGLPKLHHFFYIALSQTCCRAKYVPGRTAFDCRDLSVYVIGKK